MIRASRPWTSTSSKTVWLQENMDLLLFDGNFDRLWFAGLHYDQIRSKKRAKSLSQDWNRLFFSDFLNLCLTVKPVFL
jgi:hypothetical protein